MSSTSSRMIFLIIAFSYIPSTFPNIFGPDQNNGIVFFTKGDQTELQSHDNKHQRTSELYGLNASNDPGGAGDVGLPRSVRSAHRAAQPGSFSRHVRKTRATPTVGNCGVTGDQIDEIVNNKFHLNDSNFNLALLWTGQNSKELLALTTLEFGFMAAPSHLWLSLDYGKTFTKIDDRIEGAIIKKTNGIFKSPLISQRIILVSYKSDMDQFGSKFYISKDGGRSFKAVTVPFFPEGKIHFHPTQQDYLFVQTPNDEMRVWLSKDFGLTWTSLKSKVEVVHWGTTEMGSENDLYLLQYQESGSGLSLIKTSNLGKSYTTLQDNVQTFGLQGKFIYAAIDLEEGSSDAKQHVLHVSTDKGHTWRPTQLPVITSDRFFSVLDMNEGLIFMHVDDPGNTGTGTIYTSAADGIVFSESLTRHLFPNGGQITDFYRVESMRGVYLASKIHEDSTIHTVITYDRGGIWSPIRKPEEARCNDTGECTLQIHNQFSRMKGIDFPSGPMSHSTATGLILVHATVANGLELRPPDVYVSSDGGYNWKMALQGPHFFTITNSGGLLVAIPASETATDTIKFSYDEGQCWNSYKFSDEKITVTGLLPEPSRKSLNISIWGFGEEDSQWRSFMINFGSILRRECEESDFVHWKPHEGNGRAGCLLGQKETFKRVRVDALCRVSFEFEQMPMSSQHCSCDKADYECDYGFYRETNTSDCVLSPEFQHKDLEYCVNGREEELKTWGYRKVPGDLCQDGYQPQRNVEKMKAKCDGSQSNKSHRAAIGILLTLLVAAILVGVFIFYRKKKLPCVHISVGSYNYTQLSQGDSFDNKALDMTDSLQGYHDDSDEDMLE